MCLDVFVFVSRIKKGKERSLSSRMLSFFWQNTDATLGLQLSQGNSNFQELGNLLLILSLPFFFSFISSMTPHCFLFLPENSFSFILSLLFLVSHFYLLKFLSCSQKERKNNQWSNPHEFKEHARLYHSWGKVQLSQRWHPKTMSSQTST